ncbi:NAD(P)/FAD-dependent oxidoreductase [Jatrophihabitans sp. YIM 134969]
MPSSPLDVLVVGAGPVGLVTALRARRAGLDVAVVDRRDGVQDKACGEGLMPGALRALAELGVDPPGRPFTGIAYRQGEHVATARFRHGPGRGVRRTALSQTLRDAVADAGVPVLTADAADLRLEPDAARLGDRTARWVVAADGLHSPVRRLVGAEPTKAPRARYGWRRHYRVAPWTDTVEVTWADDSEAYVTPVADDLVGVAVLSERRAGFDEHLAAFPELHQRLQGATVASRDRAAGPLRQDVSRRAHGRVLLVGDAAGYVDALTGEGLAIGFATAADLVDCLVAGTPERYERRWRRTSRVPRVLTRGLLAVRRQPALARQVVPLAERAPWLFTAVVGRLAT